MTRRCAPRPFGVALKGDRRRYAASSNPLFVCRGFEFAPIRVKTRPALSGIFCKKSAPGGIRTHDPRLRRPILYPAELRAHGTGWRYYSPPASRVQRCVGPRRSMRPSSSTWRTESSACSETVRWSCPTPCESRPHPTPAWSCRGARVSRWRRGCPRGRCSSDWT